MLYDALKVALVGRGLLGALWRAELPEQATAFATREPVWSAVRRWAGTGNGLCARRAVLAGAGRGRRGMAETPEEEQRRSGRQGAALARERNGQSRVLRSRLDAGGTTGAAARQRCG